LFGLILAKIFAQIYWSYKKITKRNLPGLGKALDLVKREHVLKVKGKKVFFDPRIARAYGLMIIGQWNEPETHAFLGKLLDKIDTRVNFVDVGASIGEFVVDLASHDKIAKLIGFEPQVVAAEAIRKSCKLNGFDKVSIESKMITSNGNVGFFFKNERSPTASHGIHPVDANLNEFVKQGIRKISATTLDHELIGLDGRTIVLLDIEGGEYSAMKGGLNFIRKYKPLLIFEYHSVTRKSFSLKMVEELLGTDYMIYRLRSDGSVDSDLSKTWNLVAVHRATGFFGIVSSFQHKNDSRLFCDF